MSTNSELKVLHDRLLADMPEGAEHDQDTCPLCALEEDDVTTTDGGGLMPETFTKDDLDAAVAAATADLTKRLSELGAQVQESEVEQAIATAKAELETKISELEAQLDTATAARTAAETKLSETEQYWAEAIEQHEAAAALATAKAERVEAAKATKALPDDYIETHADRFAEMSAEEFEARIAEWKVVAASAKADPKNPAKPPAATALEASAPDAGGTGHLSFLSEMRAKRIDPRTLGGVSHG